MKRKLTICLSALLMIAMLSASALAATVRLAYTGGALNIRSGPGTEYKSVGTVHNGDTVSIVSAGSVWSKIKTKSGKVGYIKNLYIKDGNSNYASGTTYIDSYTAYTTASVNLRAGASTSTASMGTVAKGTKVKVLGMNNGFFLVDKNGTQGYISGKYLSTKKGSSSSSQQSSAKTKTVTASVVNVREKGGVNSDIVFKLTKGTKVTVLKVGNYWTNIEYKGKTGWIKNSYLK